MEFNVEIPASMLGDPATVGGDDIIECKVVLATGKITTIKGKVTECQFKGRDDVKLTSAKAHLVDEQT